MHLRDLATDHPFPIQRTVRIGDLWRDPEVATVPLRMDNVERLRDEFKPHMVGLPIVSVRGDDQVVVLNGSHRLEMLRQMHGDDLEIDVMAFEHLTREQEVAIFERHHKKYLHAENRDGTEPESHVWTVDIDDTATAAPKQFARFVHAVRALGDKVVFVTGHGPLETRQELLDALGIEFDSIVIVDPQEDGSGKAKVLKHLGSWFHFDNEVAFGPEIIQICPVTFQFVEPPGDVKPKEAAQAAAADLKGRMRDRFHVVRGSKLA